MAPLRRLLRIYTLQLWFNLSDPAVEEAVPSLTLSTMAVRFTACARSSVTHADRSTSRMSTTTFMPSDQRGAYAQGFNDDRSAPALTDRDLVWGLRDERIQH